MLFKLLVLDADVVLHIEDCAVSDRGRVHTMVGEHLREFIEIVLDGLLYFGLQGDQLPLSGPERIALPLEHEDFLRQSVICLEQLLLTILEPNLCVFDLNCS